MKTLSISPSLTERVYQTIVEEVLEGRLVQGEHLVQEQLATKLGVSRQPIQQAMALLKADGMVEDVGKRGLRVAALDIDMVRGHYEIREMLDSYAARKAAAAIKSGALSPTEFRAQMDALLGNGANAIKVESVRDQIAYDQALHKLIYRMSGNPVLDRMAEPNWRYLRRVMAEVLRLAEPATAIWEQHQDIIDAILAGDEDRAAQLSEHHVQFVSTRLISELTSRGLANTLRSSVA